MKIEIGGPDFPFQSCLIFGASRAGKTHFCATFPQVAMLCSRRERGYVTVRHMDPRQWYDPKTAPEIYAVDSIQDIMGHIHKDILPQVVAGKIRTVVVELTFHADDAMRAMDIDEKNGWAKFANLEQHVHNLDIVIKKHPGLRIVYNALALPEDTAKGTSGILLPGKAIARKLPALCDLSGYMRQEDCGDHVDRVLHLSAFGNYSPGHRYGSKLPELIRNPTYRDLEDLLSGRVTVKKDGTVERKLEPLKKA